MKKDKKWYVLVVSAGMMNSNLAKRQILARIMR
jgi:hypothetical protein